MPDNSQNDQPERERWPVVLERPLLRAERGLWRRYRNPDHLPPLQPGCVYVFAGQGGYRAWDPSTVLRRHTPIFVEAGSFSVVATRFRRIWVWTRVPTTEIATDLSVGIQFGCDVQDAAAVAEASLTDLRGELENRIRHVASAVDRPPYALDEIDTARREIIARLEAMYESEPVRIEGMHIAFLGAAVNPPRDLVRHLTQLRNTRWARIEHHHKHEAERERVQDAERDLLCTPERSEATAVTREERTTDQAATRQFQERDTQTERLVKQVQDWLGSDDAKRAPVDRRQLVEALLVRLINRPLDPRATGIVEMPVHTANGRTTVDVTGHIAPDDTGER
jgi:hypothetical protein